MPGWCNGSAGFVHLFLAGRSLFEAPRYLELAEGAAWNAWEDVQDEAYDLCCGDAGRSYALLAIHRVTGEDAWLQRAVRLAERAVDTVASTGDSPALYNGTIAPALLYSEIEQPYVARMPLFEAEGWPTRRTEREEDHTP